MQPSSALYGAHMVLKVHSVLVLSVWVDVVSAADLVGVICHPLHPAPAVLSF